jgi:trk system potassium uptake protein TrkA
VYVVILGAGKVGFALACWLVASDHEVAVIDWDPSRCAALEDELGGISVVGDGTDAGVLARAGCNRADIFVGASGVDEDNLIACQLARHRFGALKTISLVNIPEHEALFALLGIDVTVNATDMIGGRLREELSGAAILDLGDMR